MDIFLIATSADPVDCKDDDLRLVGGKSEREGSLQICRNGVWGSICERRSTFRYTEASIACADLGYNPAGTSLNCKSKPSLVDYILLDCNLQVHWFCHQNTSLKIVAFLRI